MGLATSVYAHGAARASVAGTQAGSGADDELGGAALWLEPVGLASEKADEEVGLAYCDTIAADCMSTDDLRVELCEGIDLDMNLKSNGLASMPSEIGQGDSPEHPALPSSDVDESRGPPRSSEPGKD